jgi:hypothetical protein
MKTTLDFPRVFLKAMIFALLWLVAFQPEPVMAKIYKYKDENGKTHFTNNPSSIPMRYRKKDSVEKFRGVYEPPPSNASGQASAEGDKNKSDKDKGFSPRDITLIKRTIEVFKTGTALGEKYKGATPTFPNGQGAVNAIQSILPVKESLAKDLEGTKVIELQGALGFLKQSISQDHEAASIGTGLKRRISSIFARLASEGEQQVSLIKKLEDALKNAKKKQEEAKKKKEEEAKKKKEEETRKAAEEAKQKAEESQRKAEEATK